MMASVGVGTPVVVTANRNDLPATAVAREEFVMDRETGGLEDALSRASIVPLAALAAPDRWGRPNRSSMERRIPTVSTGVASRIGRALRASDTTMVAMCPPEPPLIPDVRSRGLRPTR